jgi:hypothetical protein
LSTRKEFEEFKERSQKAEGRRIGSIRWSASTPSD